MELYIPDRSKPRAFICDIDGTLSDHGGLRGHFEYSKVSTDRPLYHIIHVVQSLYLSGNWNLMFVTGREEYSRKDTKDWIEAYTGLTIGPSLLPDVKLFMRPEGDYRKDSILKKEIFDNHIAPDYWVEFALDDRNQVVEMWRSIGLPCLQVAEGDF